ncbi:hypothetical protein DWB68_10880 [Galactobacter valiniphilus]|uniref:Uncharacterized protein n=1 Tax=Galactobacter valiniphilus TaxID=2676122 RepID=A0A399JC30_9MICC|nr:hypothetical protein [Galactobacter valiniphilus]RII41779.1 hypothetical protein DWB68_10880 [Galactobacter valiniphilus]
MSLDLNTLNGPEEFFEHLEWWRLQLFFPQQGQAGWRQSAEAVEQVLASRSVVAAVQSGYAVPLGLRVTVLVAVHEDRVVLFDADGNITAALEPEHLGQALALHAGAWVMELDEEPALLAGDAETLQAALNALEEGGPDPFAPAQRACVHYGEPEIAVWSVALKGSKTNGTLHRDTALLHGEPGPETAVVAGALTGSPALILRDFGSWWGLSYYSRAAMAAKVKGGEEREPTLALALGLGATLLPPAPAREPGETPAASTPAQRLAAALGAAHMLADPADADALEGAMSAVRAEQAVASLARCVPAAGTLVVGGPVARAPWLGEAADAVEMLGFDPAWVRVLAGTEREPEGGTEIVPRGVLGAAGAAFKAEFSAQPTVAVGEARPPGELPEGAPAQVPAAESATTAPPAQRGPAGGLGWTRSFAPTVRYTIGIIELGLAAVFLFLAPLPLSWLNPVLAALFTLDGAWQVWDTIRLEERSKRAGEPPQRDGSDAE